MATLPAQHPRLAIHLTDRVLTPIISSSQPQQLPTAGQPKKPSTAAFSTSPLSSSSASSTSPDTHDHPSAASLAALTHTALTSYQAAKRLSRGAPLRTLVEYPHSGPAVLHSYLCPTSLALGPTPGVAGGRRRAGSLTTAPGDAEESDDDDNDDEEALADGDGDDDDDDKKTATAAAAAKIKGKDIAAALSRGRDGGKDGNKEEEEEEDGPNAPPMLIGTVIAPAARDLKEARRAAARLERIALSLQTQWIAEGPPPGT